jgi:hypothetical protein
MTTSRVSILLLFSLVTVGAIGCAPGASDGPLNFMIAAGGTGAGADGAGQPNSMCPAGTTLCGTTCANLMINPDNCGACGKSCPEGMSCQSGLCACPSGLTECLGVCVDLNADGRNCGACGNDCVVQGLLCSQGTCSAACGGTLTDCGGSCVDLSTSMAHCGRCGNSCASHLSCIAGSCSCAGGLTDCGNQCVNTLSDALNCGSCGNQCQSGATCSNGQCQGGTATGTGGTTAGGGTGAGGSGGSIVGAGGSVVGAGGSGGNVVTAGGSGGNVVTAGGSGGSGGSGGNANTGGNESTGGNVGSGDCTFTVNSSTSSKIPTVGIVEWSVDMSSLSSAHIEFGLDTGYGLTAPVDLAEPNYRTLLLGMKGSRTYHFRVVASGSSGDCASGDYTLETGALSNQLRAVDVTTHNASALAGGYIITSEWQNGPAYILDADGDYVWWYDTSTSDPSLTRARMSYDGKYMWMATNNNEGGRGELTQVTMDGLQEQRLSPIDHTHDLAVLPDGSLVLPEYSPMMGGGECGGVWEYSPSGSVRELINISSAHGQTSCHMNSIHYFEGDDSITVSDIFGGMSGGQGCYVKLTRQGQVVWVLGGPASDFSGNGATWDGANHGHHVLASDRLIIFNNGSMGAGSTAIEIQLNLSSWTATRVWEYSSGNSSNVLGDVQRLDNGNTLVTYSDSGVIHEVDANGSLLQEISWQLGGALGYVMQRQSLYGPPPK